VNSRIVMASGGGSNRVVLIMCPTCSAALGTVLDPDDVADAVKAKIKR
jgi:hypothetical protein